MALKSNLPTLEPARKRLAKEITLLSKTHTDPVAFPDGKIVVFPWDMNLNETLQKRGFESDAEGTLVELLPQLCQLKTAKPESFFISEIMLLLMVSYAQGQSGSLTLNMQCPKCGAKHAVPVNVPDDLEKVGEKDDKWPGYDVVILPHSKDVVEFKPLRVRDLKKIQARTPDQKAVVRDGVYRIALSIVTVGKSPEDKGAPDNMLEAAHYIEALSMADIKALTDAIRENSPTLNDVVAVKCDKCEHVSKHDLHLNALFFL